MLDVDSPSVAAELEELALERLILSDLSIDISEPDSVGCTSSSLGVSSLVDMMADVSIGPMVDPEVDIPMARASEAEPHMHSPLLCA